MKKVISKLIVVKFLFFSNMVFADTISTTIELNLEKTIKLAQEQSLAAMLAKHNLQTATNSFRVYTSSFYPTVSLSGAFPNYTRRFTEEYIPADSSYAIVKSSTNRSHLNLSIDQNIYPTGGKISVNSNISRLDNIGSDLKTSYTFNPIGITFKQNISGYNELKWKKKIEPFRYEIAKRDYIISLQDIGISATNLFFDLINVQYRLEIAKVNYNNADTLFKVSQGRFKMGIIAENEVLEMELSLLNYKLELQEAEFELEFIHSKLRSFLGFNKSVRIKLSPPAQIPDIKLNYSSVYENVIKNNPEYINLKIEKLEANQMVDKTKAEKGISGNVEAGIGYARTSTELVNPDNRFTNEQLLRIGFNIPIIDWGQAKRNHLLAIDNLEIIESKIHQFQIDLEQDLSNQVMQFNLSGSQLEIAEKALDIATRRYSITKERFLMGSINVTDLNIALNERDKAEMAYISKIRDYWSDYYNIQKLALYNFTSSKSLIDEFDFSFVE